MDVKEVQIIHNLKNVYDPEIPVNIYDLGLIYDIKIDGNKCDIEMTLTSPFCPVAEELPEEVRMACFVDGIDDVSVEVTFQPPWDPTMMSEDAVMALGMM